MSQTAGVFPWLGGDGRLTGTARLLLGFVVGALFALLPMYFYMGREAALRGSNSSDQPLAATSDQRRVGAETASTRSGSKPFASRMTYELSQLPDDRPAAPPKAPPASVAVVSTPVVRAPVASPLPAPAASSPVELPVTERVVNARPISVVPPDPRDRTREIEKEAQKNEYRETARPQTKAPPSPVVGRVIEGRDVELKPLSKSTDTPARTSVAVASTDKKTADVPKKSIEDRPATTGPLVTGVTPIKPPARDGGSEAPVVANAPSTTSAVAATRAEAPASGSAGASGDAVQSRLGATREWLSAAAPTTHTIQLMGTNSEEQLRAHLKALGKVIEPGKLYVFRTKAQGKASMTVLYGAYADRKSALQALEKLPAAVAANKPVLRTVNGIRAEMKQHNTDS